MVRTHVEYEAKLGRAVERVEIVSGVKCMFGKKVATLIRSRRIVDFIPTKTQLTKINKNSGVIRITNKQIYNVNIYCRG